MTFLLMTQMQSDTERGYVVIGVIDSLLPNETYVSFGSKNKREKCILSV